ncbi:Derlin 1 [Entomortierella chlamydospora]|nr:Derlin 1 [Entomortierella chlamydospora]
MALNFNMLFDLYFIFTYGSQLEESTFAGRSADFAWFIMFTSIASTIAANFLGIYTLFHALLISIIYLWAQENSGRIVSFMFGVQFKAIYFPWVLVVYTFVLSGALIPWGMIIGIVSAHLFYFLNTTYPASGGPRLIPTPPFLYWLLPAREVAGAGFTGNGATANVYRASAPTSGGATGHQWGRGNRLS